MYKKIIAIQNELKCNKGQYNSFGGYSYRSCEDILEAVKPLLSKYQLLLRISDEIVQVGDRYYIKATAELCDTETEKTVKSEAYAREPLEKTKMDAAQVTGTASSYARKYALNGLFLIDDTKDVDTEEYNKQTGENQQQKNQQNQQQTEQQKISAATAKAINGLIDQTNSDRAELLKYYGVEKLEDLTRDKAQHCMGILKGRAAK